MDKKYIVDIKGKEFVKFEGLLNEFHNSGGKEIETEIIRTEKPYIVKATVKGEKGNFSGIGDADEKNVNPMVINHIIRIAETRAIARALRWYTNTGLCSTDELGGNDKKVYKLEKPVRVLDDKKNATKAEIKKLADELEPLLSTATEYADFIRKKTGLELSTDNYQEIIDRLTVLVGEIGNKV